MNLGWGRGTIQPIRVLFSFVAMEAEHIVVNIVLIVNVFKARCFFFLNKFRIFFWKKYYSVPFLKYLV